VPQDKPTTIVMIDDDRDFSRLVGEYLSSEGGFAFSCAEDGERGLALAIASDCDLVLLDVGLPKLDGFEVLKRIRQKSAVPVLMLTARGDEFDRVLGLEIGADDYIPKPCSLRELIARIKTVLRRSAPQAALSDPANETIRVNDLALHCGNQMVEHRGEHISLTGAEFLILELLARNAGSIVDKNSRSQHALGRRSAPYDRSVDSHISNIRKKLGPSQDGRQLLRTVRGRGYMLVSQ